MRISIGKILVGILVFALIVWSAFWLASRTAAAPAEKPPATSSEADKTATLPGIVLATPVPTPASATTATAEVARNDGQRPQPWLATNEEICDWGVPHGTNLSGQTDVYQFTNCTSFEVFPGRVLEVDWVYSQADFVHATENWEDGRGGKSFEGVAWWADVTPDANIYVEVSYAGSPVCIGNSFEIVPDVAIHAKFVNRGNSQADYVQGAVKNDIWPQCRAPIPTAQQ